MVVLKTKMIRIGKEIPAIIELSDTYRVVKKNIAKIPMQIRVGCGCIAKSRPNRVATPFPPLNPTYIGKI